MEPYELEKWMETHTLNKPFCSDPQCPCHESQLAISLIAIQVEEGFLTPDEATRIVKGEGL